MKKIGEGWQYSVYDLGNGKVLKKLNSVFRRFYFISKVILPRQIKRAYKIPNYVRAMKVKAQESFDILSRTNLDSSLIGNVVFKNGLDYEQDKVESLEDYLKRVNLEESCR
jgi:hypothetical protein